VVSDHKGIEDESWFCGLCPDCLRLLPRRLTGFCPVCGEILPETEGHNLCPACLGSPKPWGRIYFHGLYAGMMRDLVKQIKFNGRLNLAEALGLLLATHPDLAHARETYDCLIPIPAHPRRLAERGFNQALEIARPLSAMLGLPLCHGWLRRIVDTRRQHGLTRAQRAENLRHAFAAAPSAQGGRILLLDDVLTTGATLHAAAACLLQAGAALADVAVPARTPARRMGTAL
jgi:ComF family protein